MKNLRQSNNKRGNIVTHVGAKLLEEVGFTVLHPFYNERERFDLLFDNWLAWSDRVKKATQIILVDDCSPSPVVSWFTPNKLKMIKDLNIGAYRINTDLKWNTPGALNLGFTVAPHSWVLTMDSDCTFGSDDMEKFLDVAPLEDSIYKFPRQRLGDESVGENLSNTRYLPCSMLMHKNLFWGVGGFDEDFTGEYSGGYALFDTYFDRRASFLNYSWFVWDDVKAIEWMPSVAAMGRDVETKKHYAINRKIMYAKLSSEFSEEVYGKVLPVTSPILRFDWERSFWHRREEG